MRNLNRGKRILRQFYEFRFGEWGNAHEQVSFRNFLVWLVSHSTEEGYNLLGVGKVSEYLTGRLGLSRLSRIQRVIFEMRANSDYQFKQSITTKNFSNWFSSHGLDEYPALINLNCQSLQTKSFDVSAATFDVLIVCPDNPETGTVKLSRNVADVCSELGMSVKTLKFEYSEHSGDFRFEFTSLASRAKSVIYCVSLIELNYLAYVVGPDAMEKLKQVSVYYGPWELGVVPKVLRNAVNLVGEVWAISRFVQSAFNFHNNVRFIGLAHNSFLNNDQNFEEQLDFFQFLTVCAKGSYLERKNPLGAIEAFQSAFPVGELNCRFRLRIHITDVSEFGIPTEINSEDERISVTTGFLSQPDYEGMFRSSQCYVSLHRAEGFGIAVAEAVSLGMPVIVSDYGGVLDFCNSENSYLIGCRTKMIANGSYPYSHGLHWAEPDIAQAANSMFNCAASRFFRKQDNLLSGYTLAVRQRMRSRLLERNNL